MLIKETLFFMLARGSTFMQWVTRNRIKAMTNLQVVNDSIRPQKSPLMCAATQAELAARGNMSNMSS